MAPIRQFISFIPLKDCEQPCVVSVSRQYSKTLAQRQVFLDLQNQADNVQFEKICTKELIVDEDGVIRIADNEGDILTADAYKV